MAAKRMTIVEVWNNGKRLKRYTEWALDVADRMMTREEQQIKALADVKRKYGKCFPVSSEYRLAKGNQ